MTNKFVVIIIIIVIIVISVFHWLLTFKFLTEIKKTTSLSNLIILYNYKSSKYKMFLVKNFFMCVYKLNSLVLCRRHRRRHHHHHHHNNHWFGGLV